MLSRGPLLDTGLRADLSVDGAVGRLEGRAHRLRGRLAQLVKVRAEEVDHRLLGRLRGDAPKVSAVAVEDRIDRVLSFWPPLELEHEMRVLVLFARGAPVGILQVRKGERRSHRERGA